jgi:hypothetical protein
MTAKAFLRRLIVTTSVPPLVSVYRGIYSLLIRAAVWRLKQTSQLRAIYLRRGLAGGEGVPGISDIDLAAVGDWDASAQARLTEVYERFARWCPLYDPTIGVYTPASIAELFESDPFHRHRLAEGQRAWKLLFGDDCLGHLAPVSEDEAAIGFEAELKLWWTYFARWAYAEGPRDEVFLNSLCYKVVAENLRMDCGLCGRPVPNSRRRAIDEAIANAPAASAGFLTRLRASAQGRHLRYSGDVVEDSQDYLLALLEQSYCRVRRHPAWREPLGVTLQTDAPEFERLTPRDFPASAGFRMTAVSATAFAMDEIVLLFEPVSNEVPKASDLRQLVSAYVKRLAPGCRRLSLYLRLPNACYQLYASDYFRGWQAILAPGFNPDIFGGAWTRPAAEFIQRERQLMAQALDDPVVYKANNLDFLRTFWKFLELVVVEGTARRSEIIFAQTPEAVTRGLAQLNLPIAPFLDDFAAAYRSELRGEQANIGRHVPAAILYLKNIHHAL